MGHRLGHLGFRVVADEENASRCARNRSGLCVWLLPCRNREGHRVVRPALQSRLTFDAGLNPMQSRREEASRRGFEKAGPARLVSSVCAHTSAHPLNVGGFFFFFFFQVIRGPVVLEEE